VRWLSRAIGGGELAGQSYMTQEHEAFVKSALEGLRRRLLDLSNRNRLLNFKHSDRARTHIRVIDEIPDLLFDKLQRRGQLTFEALPEPRNHLRDEHTDEFQTALDSARYTDERYLAVVAELEDGDESSRAFLKAERALKDRVRQQLGLPPRPNREEMTPAEYAGSIGLDPSYDLLVTSADSAEKHRDTLIQTLLFPDQMERKLSGLRDLTRQGIQEMGINTLYAAYGFLEWYESSSSTRKMFAPLVLQPLELSRVAEAGYYRYQIRGTGEEVQHNVSLAERLRADFGLQLPEFDPNGTPDAYFETLSEIVEAKPDWKVRRFVTIGTFSFGRLVIWDDLRPEKWEDAESSPWDHSVVGELIAGRESDGGNLDPAPVHPIDELEDLPTLIAPADSSQYSAVVDVVRGRNLAIKGPPGTGKSQTITNIIGASLAAGRSVLFVAEKLAALDVVKKRLDEARLGAFCLELHSVKASRHQVLKSIVQRLELGRNLAAPRDLGVALNEQKRLRDSLNSYAALLNEPYRDSGRTVQQLMWDEIRSRRHVASLPDAVEHILDFPSGDFHPVRREAARSALEAVERAYDGIVQTFGSLKAHPWYGVGKAGMTAFEQEGLVRVCRAAFACASELRDLFREFEESIDVEFDPSPSSLKRLVGGLKDLPRELPAQLPATCLTGLADDQLFDELTLLQGHWRRRQEIDGQITRPFSEANRLGSRRSDLDALLGLARRLGVAEVPLSQIENKIGELRSHAENLEEAHSTATEIAGAFGVDGSSLEAAIETLLGALDLVEETHDGCLRGRSPALFTEDAGDRVERLRARARELEERRHRVSESTNLDGAPSSVELRQMANTIRGTGLFGRLGSRFRRTLKAAQSIAEGSVDPDRLSLADDLERAASFIDAVATFEADQTAADLLGAMFRGTATDFDRANHVVEYGRSVRRLTSGGEAWRVSIRDRLYAAPTEDLQSLVLRFDRHVRHRVRSANASSRGGLRQHAASLRERANHLELLVRAARQLSMRGAAKPCEIGTVVELLDEEAAIDAAMSALTLAGRYIGAHGGRSDVDVVWLEEALETASRIRQLGRSQPGYGGRISSFLLREGCDDRLRWLARIVRGLDEIGTRLQGILDEFQQLGALRPDFFGDSELPSTSISRVCSRLQEAADRADALGQWVAFCRSEQEAREKGLGRVLDAYGANSPWHGLTNAFDRIYVRSALEDAFKGREELRALSGATQQEARERYRQLDQQILQMQRAAIVADLSRRRPPHGRSTGPRGTWTEAALLEHQLGLTRPSAPIRDLVHRAGRAIQSLKPCFMMSPSSVAQFLPPGGMQFDLVVIDEASQMRPEEAIGAVARGGQLVVVGDQMQLPPTSFFQRIEAQASDDDEEAVDAELASDSILDMALEIFRPHRELIWHYRSRHESLIAFSNKHFYDDRLIVFPSPRPHHRDLGVHYRGVDGTYRGRGGNIDEVHAVADAAMAFMVRHPNRSLGIVTMNLQQRQLLSDEIERRIVQDERARRFVEAWEATLEPFFIKNLENVQGDERDVIMISTVYGRNQHGSMHQRFGPTGGQMGHRRLNVLFTRAKEAVELFSSMRSNDVLVGPTTSRGVVALKNYLDFAVTGRVAPGEITGRPPESPFECEVADVLLERGFGVEAQVGVEGYRIDLAVTHPNVPDGYLLGIECDGATYHSAKSARDRDALRQEVLEQLGWTIYRIWSTDWFNDRDSEVRRLLSFIEQCADEREAVQDAEPIEAGPVPTFDEFRSALPVDEAGDPDLAGVGRELISEASGGQATNFGRLSDNQKCGVMQLARQASEGSDDTEVGEAPVVETTAVRASRQVVLPLGEPEWEPVAQSEPGASDGDTVVYRFQDEPDHQIKVTLSATESDPDHGKVHVRSPLGRELAGARVGDVFEMEGGGVERVVEILQVERPAEN